MVHIIPKTFVRSHQLWGESDISITSGGFKIGGVDGHPIVTGAAMVHSTFSFFKDRGREYTAPLMRQYRVIIIIGAGDHLLP